MAKTTAGILGVVVLGAGILGLIVGEGIFASLTNVDFTFDAARIFFGALLTYYGFFQKSEDDAKNVLGTIGSIYIVMGVIGLVDNRMFGLIPNGWTGMDALFHVVTGVLGVMVAWAFGDRPRMVTG